MNTIDVIIVRIYLTESSNLLNTVINYLKHDAKIRGISVFRGISGIGESGDHTSSLVDLSFDLPLVIEFFDDKNKVESALTKLNTMIKPEHVVFWEAKTNA